jgi:ribose-phosphate pyrophosphokinase
MLKFAHENNQNFLNGIIMRINFNRLERKTFPDGMSFRALSEEYLKSLRSCAQVTLVASIRSFTDLMELGQLTEVLKRGGDVNLELHYLIGSRMDRPMNHDSPNTLKVVCDTIKSMGFNRITTVWSHSQSTNDRLEASSNTTLESSFLIRGLSKLAKEKEWAIILPDAGAAKRYWNDHACFLGSSFKVVECSKHRNMETGRLSGFNVPCEVPEECHIVDDLCDGGGTFVGLAKELRTKGAKVVNLIVYHGIFSKGIALESIDRIYTTNSFENMLQLDSFIVEDVV